MGADIGRVALACFGGDMMLDFQRPYEMLPIDWERDTGVSENIGVTRGDGLSVDIFRKKGPVEGEDFLTVTVHVPMRMIGGLELSSPEPDREE